MCDPDGILDCAQHQGAQSLEANVTNKSRLMSVGVLILGSCFAQDPASALTDAVKAGSATSVNALLAKGADPNVPGPEGITPLLVAASMGNIEIARALLAKGAAVNAQDKSSWQLAPLMVASFAGHLEMVKFLLDKGADIELKNKDGNPALFFATAGQATDHTVVNLLLERGAKKLPQKTALALMLEVGGLPLGSKCFEHIEGVRCRNTAPKKTK